MNKKPKLNDLLEGGHMESLERAERLQEVLRNLRYEGKASLGRNLREAQEVQGFFNEELNHHVRFEEEVVFPFLKTHLPRLEPMIWFLQAEHQDFRLNLETFRCRLGELVKTKEEGARVRIIEKIQETGTYLIYLFRNHIRAESEYLYQAAERELRSEEKNRLIQQLARNTRSGPKPALRH